MDTNMPPSSWVMQAVEAMKDTDVYQTKIKDSYYRTLPVPVWNSQRTWIVVGVGKSRQTGGIQGRVTSQPPHLVCIIEWPQATIHWVDVDADRAWPYQPGLPAPSIPDTNPRKAWDLTVHYYNALSKALERGAFSAQTPANPPAACAAARDVRASFMPASPYKSLAPYYATPLHDIDGWIAAHCGKH